MLTSTFIHSPGVGETTERKLWAHGLTDWREFVDSHQNVKIPKRSLYEICRTVDASVEALGARDSSYFAKQIPARWHWRAQSEFNKLGYLDIETDGGFDPSSITIIGLSDGFDTRTYIKGKDLHEFVADCSEFDGFVTFFGGGFDIPFLKRRFPELVPLFRDRLHIDLCPVLKSIGYSGGLKCIEQKLGICRVPETDGLNGFDAVKLWRTYVRGGNSSDDALRLLIAYNREDVQNMKTLLDFALPRLRTATGFPG